MSEEKTQETTGKEEKKQSLVDVLFEEVAGEMSEEERKAAKMEIKAALNRYSQARKVLKNCEHELNELRVQLSMKLGN